MGIQPLILTGEKVAIRVMKTEDQPLFQQWLAGSSELRTLINDPRIPTMDDQMHWFKRTQRPDRKLLSIVLLDGQLIGNGGFVDIDVQAKTAVFRITIGSPEALGKGYGTEATRLLLQFGFQTLVLDRVILAVLASNERAIRTYRKIGFTEIKSMPNDEHDMMRFVISREQFFSSAHEHLYYNF